MPINTRTPNDAVSAEHPEYLHAKPDWHLIGDCVKGSRAVKAKGDKYLPRPCPADTSDENKKRYVNYLKRAIFYNVTARTLHGLAGEVTKKEPVLEIPTLLSTLENDADGAGIPLLQHAACTLREVLASGRAGLLTDYPRVDNPASIQDLEDGRVRPNIVAYKALDIINWRTAKVGVETVLTLVVLKEDTIEEEGDFTSEVVTTYRVLRLRDGRYSVELHKERNGVESIEVEEHYPVDGAGASMTRIPFVFVGSSKNSVEIDPPPMLDIAELNLAHYINSADNEEMCHILGQPTLYFAGLSEHWVKEVMGGSVQIGARASVPLPEGGSAGILQVAPNTVISEAMAAKEDQMVALGARLVDDTAKGPKTATQVITEDASEASVLTNVANNVSNAYLKALEYAAGFNNQEKGEIVFELNTDFDLHTLDAQNQTSLLALEMSGLINFEEARTRLRKAGIATEEDEVVKRQRAENATPDIDTKPSTDAE